MVNRDALLVGSVRLGASMSLPRSTVLAVLLFQFSFPDPAGATTAGPITELATTPVAGQRAPSIAWDGTQYVIVWEDARLAATNGTDLYVARVAPDGTLMDPNGIGLLENSVLGGNQTQPQIVWNPNAAAHAIVWQSAHLGSPDIFFARFLPGTGSTIPSAGVLATDGGTDAESRPGVYYTANQYLITFQTIFDGVPGVSRIQARRLQLDGVNFLDPAPFNIVDPAAGSTFETNAAVLSVGSNFLVAWQDDRNGNVDLFARTIPDSGAVPSDTGTALGPAQLSQNSVSWSPLGVGNLMAVWQDGSNTIDQDVSGRRFTGTLTSLGPVQTISGAVNDQREPKIAGDSTGGLVVWQDRRNGSLNGITYGARLDASGNVLDPEGFPIMIYNRNSFEHAVAKGPGDDYLVASVRFDATTPRIHYRIVRNEVPDGTMTGTGQAMVPADGVTTADITFGPAVGQSGLDVVDQTLYTVMLSQPGVEIVAPDADPSTPGHQVPAVSGEVFLQLRTVEHVMVDVTVSSVEGSSSGTAQVTFLNVPPSVSNVQVSPAPMPRSTEDLTLTYTYSDVNMDPEMGTILQWTRNSAVQGQVTGTTVPASETRKGDEWRVGVTPSDGQTQNPLGAQVFSNIVTIGNSPPVALNPSITPNNDVRTGTELTAGYLFDDPDGDGEGASELRWYESGTERTDLFNQDTVPGTEVIKGQSWYFTVLPHDGTEPGDLVTSPTIDVVNTAPVARAGMDDSVLERRRYVLDGTASSDIDPQDGLTYTWTQVQNGSAEVELSSTSSPTPSFMAPSILVSEPLQFDLVVNDGDVDSPADRVVITVTPIQNSDPDDLDDEEEMEAGTDPTAGDTDKDGLDDYQEVRIAFTNPLDEDTDDDGVRDGAEGQICRNCDADPLGDADGDQVINALDPDSDDDMLMDGTELGIRNPLNGGGTAPYEYAGTDEGAGFFIADADPNTTTNPIDPDTDQDTFLDGVEDANHDGRVDDGESDPNDPTDPGIPCTAGGAECPQGLACGPDGLCVMDETSDGGPVCMPLSESLECCMGGCVGGTKVDPICTSNGALESCPIGATQCRANSCEDPFEPKPEDGCGCTETGGRPAGGLALLLVMMMLVVMVRAEDR